jgi:hypothetical protein
VAGQGGAFEMGSVPEMACPRWGVGVSRGSALRDRADNETEYGNGTICVQLRRAIYIVDTIDAFCLCWICPFTLRYSICPQ